MAHSTLFPDPPILGQLTTTSWANLVCCRACGDSGGMEKQASGTCAPDSSVRLGCHGKSGVCMTHFKRNLRFSHSLDIRGKVAASAIVGIAALLVLSLVIVTSVVLRGTFRGV